MIIGSLLPLEIGKIYDETTHKNGDEVPALHLETNGGKHYKFRFMVLGIATHEEYMRELMREGTVLNSVDLNPGEYKFYKISMD